MLCQEGSSSGRNGGCLSSLCSNDEGFPRASPGPAWGLDNPKEIIMHMYTEKKPKEEEEEGKRAEKGNRNRSLYFYSVYTHIFS